MENIKNFIKKHKKEILLVGGTIVVIGGCIFIGARLKTKPVYHEACGMATFVPNDVENTVDMFVRCGEDMNHLYVYSVDEAEGLLKELADSIACLKK